ncbi:hypothetical protein B0H19DRAFT_1068612 [Mycena capillaripes]|nr:hypothetical protein B0H19DRAFT_1068612 [Mycena capillaripes]
MQASALSTKPNRSAHQVYSRAFAIEQPRLLLLKAPLLEELFCVSMENSLTNLLGILSFVHSFSCTSPTALMNVLRGLPGLTDLLIEASRYWLEDDKTLFKDMMISDSSDDLCPHLTSLVYGFAPESTFYLAPQFFAMARSRFQLGRLTKLRIFSGDLKSCPPDLEASIQLMCDEGLDVEFLDEHEANLLKWKE